MSFVTALEIAFAASAATARRSTATGCHVSAAFLGGADQLGEIDLAGRGQHDVAGAVAAVEIAAHRLDRQIGDAFGGAQHASAQRMRAEIGRPAFLVGPERRLVLVHLDLFDDHLFLGVEILFAQRGAQDVGQQLHGRRDTPATRRRNRPCSPRW